MNEDDPFWYPADLPRDVGALRVLFAGAIGRPAARAIPPGAALAECVAIKPGWWARYGMDILPPDLAEAVYMGHREAVRLYYGDEAKDAP